MTFKSLARIPVFLTITVLFQALHALAQPEPTLAWAKRIGNNSTPDMYAPIVTIDQQGNSYLAGVWLPHSYTMDGISLTPPISTEQNAPHGYIAKYDPNGQILWAKSMTRIMAFSEILNTSYPNKLITDGQGNIYLCALGAVDAHSIINGHYLTDPNATLGITGHQYNMFLAKMDADGNVVWVKKTAHPHYSISSGDGVSRFTNEIHFDPEGNINITGGFRDSIRFSSNNMLTTNAGETAVFIAKYSPAGDVLQAKKLEGSVYPRNQFGTEHVRADASGNLYRWSNRAGNNPKCLYRYDAEGEFLDSLNITALSTNYATELKNFAVSPAGDVFIGGYFFGNLTLEGTTYNGYGNSNSADAVLFKLAAPNYGINWVKIHRTVRSDSFIQLLTDGLGNVYATGAYGNAQEAASVLHKYTNDGNLLWEKLMTGLPTPQTPTTGFVITTSLCQSQNGGNIWVAGRFSTNAYFSANDHFTTPANNHYNGFLAQYGVCSTANPVITTPPATTLCGQESITLSANLSNPGLTYFWSTPNGTVAIGGSETTTELTVTQPGKYYLVAQEDAECYGKSQEIWVTQGNLPNVTITESNNTLTATETTQGTTYQWLDCNNGYAQINGANEVTFTPVQNGSYAVVVTSQHGCADTSACINIHSLGINEIGSTELVEVYPNPAKEEINIHSETEIKSVRILDLQGKELIRGKGDKITVSGLASGVYIIEISTTKGTATKKFIKD